MSIANNITGGSGSSNQLLDLLAVVANPDVYKAKLDALEEATAENKKYVEAIGPASEIVALRDEAVVAAQSAKDALAQAQAQAEQMKQDAAVNASTVLTDAQSKAASLVAEAAKTQENADKILAQAKAELATSQAVTLSAEKAQAAAVAKEQELSAALSAAQTAKEEAQAVKADILAKHEAFIKGL